MAGCDLVIGEQAVGTDLERPGLEEALLRCGPGDELLVWRLDRLSRKHLHVNQVLDYLVATRTRFRIIEGLGSSIDADYPEGRILIGLLAGFCEYEWESIRTRSRAGKRGRSIWSRIEGRHTAKFNRKAGAASGAAE